MSGVVLSIDAMGGDRAPASVLGGLAKALRERPDLRFILHGDEARLAPLLKKGAPLAASVELRPAPDVVAMDAKPSQVLRRGRSTSMWKALEAVRDGEASAAVSAGNTGALMAMALFCLRAAPGVKRPAIGALWPSRNASGYSLALDMGADVRADAEDLVLYALMGAEYARVRFQAPRPRVGLLNVGVEETKGLPEIKEAGAELRRLSEDPSLAFEYVGFVEANDIFSGEVDVVVTDGFTGNTALKSAEGAAKFVGESLKSAFAHTWLSRLGAFFAYPSLRRFKKRIDPRQANGGVFLGLNGLVIKSHGGADATAYAAAVALAADLAREDVGSRIAAGVRKASSPPAAVGAPPAGLIIPPRREEGGSS
ncbi:phosphate acyltransferase PlsX [Neomegalonema perideroedes]|uniref:phosphate acyltransferase PlsX n=1 Tax=Neomegalonema perideroedes TaxID=217219 RepID=UPI0003670564|nr:phosphate acyltransferase PlsX [Neomegalonema perideroedes]